MNLLEVDQNSESYAAAWARSAWPTIAAAAYRGFLAHGRGALFVDFRRADSDATFLGGLRAPLEFVPLAELLDAPTLRDVIERYNPELEVLCVVIRKEGPPLSLTVTSPDVTLRQAAEQAAMASAVVPELRGYRMAVG
jgi:hypothetical protein